MNGVVFWPSYSSTNESKSNKGDSLGKDDFLKILITQLQHQDPTQPLQDREFIAQMAQFTAVEQMTNIANEIQLMRQSLGISASLIGQWISWKMKDPATGESLEGSGVVEAIRIIDGKQHVHVEGVDIPVDRIVQIRASEEST